MALEVFETGTAEYGRWIKALIVGPPGSGKTLLSSTFPNNFYASAEGGLMSIADRKVKGTKISASAQMNELLTILRQKPEARTEMLQLDRPVDTVVIDTIDEIQGIFIRERKASEKIDTFRVQDWGWLGDKMQQLIRNFRNLDMHVVFTCHMKDDKDEESGRVSMKPDLSGSTCRFIPGAVDLALRLSAKSELKIVDKTPQRITERLLITYPDAQHDWVKDRSGKLPPEMVVDFETDYERIDRFIFGGEFQPRTLTTPGDVEPRALVTPGDKDDGARAGQNCDVCGEPVDEKQAVLSNLRFRKVLCKSDFQSENTKGKVKNNG